MSKSHCSQLPCSQLHSVTHKHQCPRLPLLSSEPYGFSKTLVLQGRASTPATRLIAAAHAASQASPRLKHICADRRVLTSRQSPPRHGKDLEVLNVYVVYLTNSTLGKSSNCLSPVRNFNLCFIDKM